MRGLLWQFLDTMEGHQSGFGAPDGESVSGAHGEVFVVSSSLPYIYMYYGVILYLSGRCLVYLFYVLGVLCCLNVIMLLSSLFSSSILLNVLYCCCVWPAFVFVLFEFVEILLELFLYKLLSEFFWHVLFIEFTSKVF